MADLFVFVKFLMLVFSQIFERNKERREAKEKLNKELKDAIAKDDTSAITAAFSRAKRL